MAREGRSAYDEAMDLLAQWSIGWTTRQRPGLLPDLCAMIERLERENSECPFDCDYCRADPEQETP